MVWFQNSVRRSVGSGSNTLFWHDSLLGENSLKNLFPRLFQNSLQKDTLVSDMWHVSGGSREWVWRCKV
ncbi:hypothetical protein JHK82_036757 [Glycine max]|nr:hypothetical protein JHK86_036958 [Glycine max]KAG5113488.1 hypothetical protein JHK82_036757 [Glycine max]KAG5130765.1 hypothetical protein JHK84_037162 [Glycine max]